MLWRMGWSQRMPDFTLKDLEKRVKERAKASADLSYTRKLLDRGVVHCAKKLGEEAIETVLAAVAEDRERLIAEAADLIYHLLVVLAARGIALADVEAALSGRPAQDQAASRASPGRVSEGGDVAAYRGRSLALPRVLACRMGGKAQRHPDDAAGRRGDAAALAQRPARHRRGRGDLPAAIAAAVALRGGDPAPVPGAAELPRHRGREGALHHRGRRFGGGGQVDHCARAAGAAGALAERSQGRSRHHRRLSLPQRDSR